MAKNPISPRTRIGPVRLGIQYQDAVVLSLLVDWLGNRQRYVRVRLEASDDSGSLDDIRAEKPDLTIELRQVKYSVDADSEVSEWAWDTLLRIPKRSKASLLARWSKSFSQVAEGKQPVRVEVITNRRAASDLSASMRSGAVDLDTVVDPEIRAKIIEQIGGESAAREFFRNCRFRFSESSLAELYEGARRRFFALNGDAAGWVNLEHEVERWAVEKTDEWRPDGYVTIGALLHAAQWNRLRPLSQEVEVPEDFQLPNTAFDDALVDELAHNPQPCTVIVGPPGIGKSTYVSHLFAKLRERDVPAIRHHYHLSFAKRDATRMDHRVAAESLLHDLRETFPHALGELLTHNPEPEALRQHLVEAGSFYGKAGRLLIVLLDGLDHVWREKDSIEELRRLFEMLLPLPVGVVLLVATQPVSDDRLPNGLLQTAPRAYWRSLPYLDLSAVRAWLKHHWGDIRPDSSEQTANHFFDEASQVLHERSGGHPLHLRYTVEALKARGQSATRDNIHALPACSHADITNYYAELWRSLEAPAKLLLQLLAACPFPWPPDGLDAVLRQQGVSLADAQRARRSVEHLLAQAGLGLQPFHRSLAIWIEDQPDFAPALLPLRQSAAIWLASDAPEVLRWSYLWPLQADLGNLEPLINGLSRSWAVDAIAKRRSWRRIRELLERGAREAFEHQRYERAIAIGLVAEYFEFYTDANFNWEELFPAQLACPLDSRLAGRLRLELDEMRSKEIVWLAEEMHARGDQNTVSQCFNILKRRFHDSLDIRDSHRRQESHGDPIYAMRVSILLNNESGFNWALGLLKTNLKHQLAPALVKAMLDQARRSRVVARARAILAFLATISESPSPGILYAASSGAFLLANEENVDFTVEFDATRLQTCCEAVLLRALRGKTVTLDPEPPSVAAFRGRMDLMERRSIGRRICIAAFRYFLANHLLQRSRKNQQWLDAFPPRECLPDFLLQLDRVTAALTVEIHEGRIPGVGWLFQQFSSIRSARQFGPRFEEGYDFASAGGEALTDIGFELLAYARGRGLPARVEREDLETLSRSGFWFSGLWLNALAEQRRDWLSPAALAWLIERESSELQTKVEDFNSRAETCRALAVVCAWHSDYTHAQDFTRLAADNFLTHGNHKDVLFYRTLGAIEEFIRGGGGRDGSVRAWLLRLAVPIEHIRSFTDGDETRYLPGQLAEVMLCAEPDLFRPYYQHLCNRESYWEATRALNELIEHADLSRAENQALARTAIDRGSLRILERRAASGDPGALSIKSALLKELGNGTFDNLEDEHPSSSLPPQTVFDPPPSPEGFPPAKLNDYFSAGHTSGNLEDRLLERWLAHWRTHATTAELFEALQARCKFSASVFRHHDELYELARLHLGNSGAFLWLVDAHALNYGWQMGWSDDDATKRFGQVRTHYPDRWEEFLRESVLKMWKEFRRGGMIGNGNWPRLIEFLMVVGQQTLARSMVDQMVTSALEMVSPQTFTQPGWIQQQQPKHD